MTMDLQNKRTLSSVAAVFSAFFVFLLGGGVVLKVWVDQRDSAPQSTMIQSEVEAVKAHAQEGPAEEVAKPATSPVAKTAQPEARRSSTVTPAPAPSIEEPGLADGPAPSPPAVRTGKGTVIVMGGASRVQLMGAKGTFGAGTVPAGSYTIQATFSGSDPRMAGTVEVNNGQRIIVMCSETTQKCAQR